MRKAVVFALVFVLPALGAAGGWLAGPTMARLHDTVKLAARIEREDTQKLTERTLESDAFRRTGRPTADLYAEARAVEHSFTIGGLFLGAWCGLVVGVKVFALNRTRVQEDYEVDPALCVSCGRCFLTCPRERLRLKEREMGSCETEESVRAER